MPDDKWNDWVERLQSRGERQRLSEPTAEPRKGKWFQFSLTTLLLLPVVSAVVCLGYVWGETAGLIVAVLAGAIVFSYLPRFEVSAHWRIVREAFRIIGFLVIVVILLDGAREASQEAARRTQCRNNMKQVAIALQNYHADFGSYPPAYVADEIDKPMHSWRVLLLPYLEAKPLYDKYNCSEPWDGPNNILLASRGPEVYCCPSDYHWSTGETSFMVAVGDGTLWPGKEPYSIIDGVPRLLDTVLLVEVADSGTSWLEPKDLNIDEMNLEINDFSRPGIRSHHRGGAHALFGDGTVRFLTRRDEGDLKQLLRIDGSRVNQP